MLQQYSTASAVSSAVLLAVALVSAVVMPLRASVHTGGVAKMSNAESQGDAGVEIKVNDPFEDDRGKGQYTEKIYHLGSRVPRWIAAIAPADALKLEEKAWNLFPYCKTVLTNPMMGDRFQFTIESHHFENDKGQQENVFKLGKSELKAREVKFVDLTNDLQNAAEYKEEEDPCKYKSKKTGRGPLEKGKWQDNADPIMCAYKMVTVEFRYWGLQGKTENYIHGIQENLLHKFHRTMFCWQDEWHGMTEEDIRAYEDKLAEEMNKKRKEQEEATAK